RRDQRFFRPGQRLNDNVDFTLQSWLRPSTAGAPCCRRWSRRDQRFFRPGQRLNDNVDFTLQSWLRPSTAGA
ncbi:hypothetical protein CK247_31030, partial [Klebsiella pneumoniae]